MCTCVYVCVRVPTGGKRETIPSKGLWVCGTELLLHCTLSWRFPEDEYDIHSYLNPTLRLATVNRYSPTVGRGVEMSVLHSLQDTLPCEEQLCM